MTEQVISYRRPRRKRGHGLTRLGALAVTAAALVVGTWLAPYVYRPPAPDIAPLKTAAGPAPLKLPRDATKDIVSEAAATQPAVAEAPRLRRPRHSPVPLNAQPEIVGEDYEVLSASELDAISQADN